MTTLVRVAVCAALLPLLFAIGACSTSKGSRAPSAAGDAGVGQTPSASTRGGGYYLDDGPGHLSPADVASIPDAVPRAEPVLARTSRPYTVFGRTYTPMNALVPYRERGVASWYGRRYHGNPTSSGERYDMYAMTAAHPTLPIPSYVRVTRLDTGRSVVVRVNDRGPFLQNRLIDLSYTAAAKLGFVQMGSAQVEVETITQFGPSDPTPVQVVQGVVEGAPQAVAVPAAAAVPVARVGSAAASAEPDVAASASVSSAANVPAATPRAAIAPASPAASMASPAESTPPRLAVQTSFAHEAPSQQAPQAPFVSGPTSSQEAATPTAAHDGPGFWLQLGAFASVDRARTALDRFRRELAWLGAEFDLRREGDLYKLQAGPWPQREHALDAAARIRRATALQPFPVFR